MNRAGTDRLFKHPARGTARVAWLGALSLTLGFALWSGTAGAAALDHLRNFATQTKTARGEFTQRVVSRTQRATQPARGEFSFERPGKFRWAYLKPYEQVIVADGQTLGIYDKDLAQATIKKLDEALGATPAAILFGSNDLEKRFDLKEAGVRDGIEWLEATPKARDTTFERIGIGFRDGELAAMELRDALGQLTVLTFAKIERNVRLAPDVFRLNLPKGVDVLKQ